MRNLTRRFMLGAAATLLGVAPGSGSSAGPSAALTIERRKIQIGRRRADAVLVNGSLPGPTLRFREGEVVSITVTNRMDQPTSIHWHGVRVPSDMDGVPGLSFHGIAPGETFVYRFELHQSGTYWYHAHTDGQEQEGLYGAFIIEPADGWAEAFEREHIVMLSDWTDETPARIVHNLKTRPDHYNRGQRTLGTFAADVARQGLAATLADRVAWGEMRMSPTDLADVTGATYDFLMNGQTAEANWTALCRIGERVRLRVINASSMTFFDVRIPGLKLRVVEADGNDLVPLEVDEFRIGPAETYDVIVRPTASAHTIFAQTLDRSGFARGTLATSPGLAAPVPALDPRPLRTMADMGMDHGAHGGHAGHVMPPGAAPNAHAGHATGAPANGAMDHAAMGHGSGGPLPVTENRPSAGAVGVDNIAETTWSDLDRPGIGLAGNGRRVLTYADLKARLPGADPRPPSREIVLHLTGNMQRYIWGFDGRRMEDTGPLELRVDERVRITLVNDTMMEHPVHLHGLWSELENAHGEFRPYKHTIIVQPAQRVSFLVTADEPGAWAFHCHLLYHMALGMMRTVLVA